MSPDLPSSPAGSPLALRVARARHDLHNSIGHIHGFSEMWFEEFEASGPGDLRDLLDHVRQTASRMVALTTKSLHADAIESGSINLPGLQRELADHSSNILKEVKTLRRRARGLDSVFQGDLGRIEAAARRALGLARTSINSLLLREPSEPLHPAASANPLTQLVAGTLDPQTAPPSNREGLVLVVDDFEENRELLSRRLSRLGYSVKTIAGGKEALEFIRGNAVDLMLLDILMPGLDGFEVLRELKADPALRHIPVVMLSSEDQVETGVRCIKLGADDFLPKPFNATLLMARVESSLSRKRLRDHETALLQRVQAEQNLSESLLLNILPRPIADRLKKGEKVIADSFSEVTVLFTDFVDFTRLSTSIAPDLLVSRLNDIFSAFDRLCEQHGLEKIKMIGDAYMAVGGLPTPSENHPQAVAEVALAMQQAAAKFTLGKGQPCRMRIGINTGPVVAGVIGTKKFAYDLWGDTVNIASRMESHAPPRGILVNASTYARLKNDYTFKPGRMIRVKGKGQLLTYLLLERKGRKNP